MDDFCLSPKRKSCEKKKHRKESKRKFIAISTVKRICLLFNSPSEAERIASQEFQPSKHSLGTMYLEIEKTSRITKHHSFLLVTNNNCNNETNGRTKTRRRLLKRNHQSFAGLYRITGEAGPHIFSINEDGIPTKVSIDRLRSYIPRYRCQRNFRVPLGLHQLNYIPGHI